MPTLILPLLFLTAGFLAIYYYRLIPSATELRQRLPNKVSWAAMVLTFFIGLAIWLIFHHSETPFRKISGLTTLLFYLLTFETILLLLFRRTSSNLVAVIGALAVTLVPFTVQFYRPSHALSNLVIIVAVMGATALLVRLGYFRPRLMILLAVLLAINDALNVYFLVPRLGLTPVSQPQPLLIFPVVTIGSRIVGSGDFMFLVLTTLIILREFGRRLALIYAAAQSLALFATFLIIVRFPGDFPFLTVMTPIFLATFFIGGRKLKTANVSQADN